MLNITILHTVQGVPKKATFSNSNERVNSNNLLYSISKDAVSHD